MAVEANSLSEVAELLIPQLLRRLSRGSAKKLDPESELERRAYAVKRLEASLRSAVPSSVLNDSDVDPIELICYCYDLLKGHSPKDLAAIFGLGDSLEITPLSGCQTPLYLPHISESRPVPWRRLHGELQAQDLA